MTGLPSRNAILAGVSALLVLVVAGIYLRAPAPEAGSANPAVVAPAPKSVPAPRPVQTPPVTAESPRPTLQAGNHSPIINPPFRSMQSYAYDDYGRMTGVTLTLSVDASDPDGDPLTYTWTATTGTITGTGPRVNWTPPIEMGAPADGIVTVVVSDGKGGQVKHEFTVGR